MEALPSLITDLTILLAIAAVTTLLCKRINLPSVLGYILAGFLAGPVVAVLPTIDDMATIQVWSDIGVIFLMFGLGLEFSVHKMGEVGVPGFLSAGIQAVGMGIVGFFLGVLLGWSTMDAVFLGVMLAMSSTMITMKSIEDMGLKDAPFASLAMGTLVIEDIIAIFAMVILSTIAVSQSISGLELAGRLVLLLFYLALWLILGTFLLPTAMKKLIGLMNDEVLLIFSLALCFLMALLADRIGLSTELGAFLAGSLLAGTVHAERVEHLVTPCKNLFGAVFFISVGFMVQPGMIVKYIGPILLLAAVAIAGKLLFLLLGGLAAGKPMDVALQAGAAQTQVGEFSFILAGLGQSLSVTGAFLYPIIVAVSVLTTFTTPFVLKASPALCRWLEARLPKKWLAALDRYVQAREKDAGAQRGDWTLFLKGYFRNFALYGVLALGVILIGVQTLLPYLTARMPDRTEVIVELAACGVIYLFLLILLPAMLRAPKRYFTPLWLEGLSNRVLLTILLVFRVGVAVLLAVLPAFLVFRVNPLYLALGAVPVVYLATRSNKLAGRYLSVEARFLANFNERKLADRFGGGEGEEVHHWLTEQLTVAALVCPKDWADDGRTLMDLDWGRNHRIKVIRILRGRERKNIPEGHVRLKGGDTLVVMGDRRQVESFCLLQAQNGVHPAEGTVFRTLKEFIEDQAGVPEAKQLLCCGVSLEREMPQAGKSIRDSGIKTDWSAFLIGLERELLPIPDPDPNLTLRDGDLLWVMGSQEMAGKLVAAGLLD